jgi:hypothetical protein
MLFHLRSPTLAKIKRVPASLRRTIRVFLTALARPINLLCSPRKNHLPGALCGAIRISCAQPGFPAVIQRLLRYSSASSGALRAMRIGMITTPCGTLQRFARQKEQKKGLKC